MNLRFRSETWCFIHNPRRFPTAATSGGGLGCDSSVWSSQIQTYSSAATTSPHTEIAAAMTVATTNTSRTSDQPNRLWEAIASCSSPMNPPTARATKLRNFVRWSFSEARTDGDGGAEEADSTSDTDQRGFGPGVRRVKALPRPIGSPNCGNVWGAGEHDSSHQRIHASLWAAAKVKSWSAKNGSGLNEHAKANSSTSKCGLRLFAAPRNGKSSKRGQTG